MLTRPRGKKGESIQSRLILLLLFILIPVLAIQAYIYYDTYQAQRASELQANLELARAAAKTFASFVQDVLHHELAIGLAITSSQPITSEDIARLLSTSREIDAIRDYTWMNPEGVAVYSSNPDMVGRNYGDRPYFLDVANGREWTVGELVLARTTGKPVFGISRGIRDGKGTLLGVVVATAIPEKLDALLAVERSKGGGVALVDHKGMLVYRYPAIDTTWKERNWLRQYPEFEEVLKGKEVSKTVYASFEGKDRLVSFIPVSSIGWAVTAGRAVEEVTGPILLSLASSALLFLSVSLAAFFIALAVSRKITRPVRTLHAHALALGRGEEPEQVRLNDISEFQDLAEAFNTMAGKVQARETALLESEERLRFALETSHTGAWDLDLADHTAFRSLEHDRIFGYTELLPQWTYEMFLDHVLAEDRDEVDAKFRHATETHSDWRFECRIRRADGEVRWILAAGRHREDATGAPHRMAGIVQDITERKRAEEVLQTTLKRFYNVLSSMYAGILLVTDEGRIEYANQAFCDLFNLEESPAEIEGLAPQEMIEKIRSTYLQPDEAVARIAEIVRLGQPVKGEEITMTEGRTYLRDFIQLHVGEKSYGRLWHHLDVTEHKQAEDVLRKERDFSAAVLDTAGALVVVLDAQDRIKRFNRACEDITGYTAEEIMGRVFLEFLIPPEDIQGVREAWSALRAGNFPNQHDNHWVAKDGSRRLIAWTNTAITREDGSIEYIVGTGLDITERQRMEEELRKAKDEMEERVKERTYELYEESLYARSLIEASLDPLVTISVDGKITDVSRATEEATGVSREQLVGSDFSDYFTEPQKARAGYEEVFRQGLVRDYPLELKHRDGQVTPVLYNATLYRDEKGQIMGVFAAARDITIRKKAEETVKAERQRLYDVLETLPVYVILLTPDYHVPFANRFFRERFGESEGKRCYEYLFKRMEPCEICESFTVQKTGKRHHWEWMGPDGKNYDIFDFPFTDFDGSPLIMEVGIDITLRKQAEAALRKLASELVMAEERERKRIAGVLHDDIAQILAAARMQLGLLQGIPSDPNNKHTLDEIKSLISQSIQETRALMNDLGNPLLFDMGLQAACEALANSLMERHPVRIVCDIRDAFKYVNPDVKTILYQLIRELLNNVVKHSQARNAHVLLGMENGQFQVKVTDDGVGFDPQLLGTPTVEGGFGLYSIRERLLAIDGSLRIESAPGSGTIVTAVLPAVLD